MIKNIVKSLNFLTQCQNDKILLIGSMNIMNLLFSDQINIYTNTFV